MQIISEQVRKAAKDHDCSLCGRLIPVGCEYSRVFARPYDANRHDKPQTLHLCLGCHLPESRRHIPPENGPDGYEYIRRFYKVPIRIGQRVQCCDRMGTVLIPRSHHHWVSTRLDGDKRAAHDHPWSLVYFNEDGTVAYDHKAMKPEGVA